VSRRARIAFAALVAAMVAVPLASIAWNEAKLASGEKVRLQVQPVDPVDFFRGEYVALDYAIARIPTQGIGPGETVYVPLRADGEIWTGDRITTEPPGDGTFIRGRTRRFGGIEFGIETFFVEEGEARRYEEAMVDGRLYADVVLDDDGKARLEDLVIRGQ
jgi:uncharacterized membrane-anchored protein